MAKYSSRRSTTIFIKHHGAVQKSVYFRVNPQALRVQQGNKGSVVDTLGGYFREVLYSKDPQHNGLMLPDLTIECDTGAGYREELKKFEWIWRHHGDRKADGTPADTFLMDFADDTVGWQDGAVAAGGMPRMGGHVHGAKGNDLAPPIGDIGRTHGAAYTLKGLLSGQARGTMQEALIRNNRGSRFLPRVFKIEILNFAWDETVQDPFRIRFNFRCKILRDMLWKVEPQERTGRTMFALAQSTGDWQNGQVAPFGDAATGGGSMAGVGSQEYPLNLPAHASATRGTLNSLSGAVPQLTQPADDSLGAVLGQAGLGQNRVADKIFDLGRSVFSVNQPIYPQGDPQGLGNVNTTLSDIIRNLPQIVTSGPQTILQSPGWIAPQIPSLSDLVNFGLPDLSFFQGLVRQSVDNGTGDAGGPTESDAYPSTRYGEISL